MKQSKWLLTSVFALSIFSGSLLLFQVQPLLGKYILPWFGGTSAVWITAMLFFQVLLLVGYAYIFLLGRFSLKIQTLLHGGIVIGISLLIFSLFSSWPAPIMPSIDLKLSDTWSPILQVLAFLALSVGLPYFLLSTTSIVLQKWFSQIYVGKSPYIFYALSNAASLIGVVSYPFLIEPFLQLHQQGIWWSIGFLLYSAALAIACALSFVALRKKTKQILPTKAKKEIVVPVTKKIIAFWVVLAGTSTLMLLSITTLLTQSVAPIPFLWLLPLSLYLLSFILAFSGPRWYKRNFYAYIFLLIAPLGIVFIQTTTPGVYSGIIIYAIILFSICMICHGELYAHRPHPKYLDIFYVIIALGGALSGFLVGVLAPLFFPAMLEVNLAFYIGILIAIFVLIHYKQSRAYRVSKLIFTSPMQLYVMVAILLPLIIIIESHMLYMRSGFQSLHSMRNFYGFLNVRERTIDGLTTRQLIHGNINHGSQLMSGNLQRTPTMYFTEESGIGIVLSYFAAKKEPVHIGILGLGIGTLAAYADKGDHYRFYEINPQVVEVAQKDFTFLTDAPAKISVFEGDGRLSLEQEVKAQDPEKFDVLVMDAFSDDSVPFHLLTKEAASIYLARLKPDGVLAFNISNKYLDLRAPLCRLAKEFDLTCIFVANDHGKYATPSHWIIMTKNKDVLAIPALKEAAKKQNIKESALWTDSYSNLLQVIKR